MSVNWVSVKTKPLLSSQFHLAPKHKKKKYIHVVGLWGETHHNPQIWTCFTLDTPWQKRKRKEKHMSILCTLQSYILNQHHQLEGLLAECHVWLNTWNASITPWNYSERDVVTCINYMMDRWHKIVINFLFFIFSQNVKWFNKECVI